MVNEVLDGITRAIHEEFGDGYPIHVDETEQNLKNPCFMALLLSTAESPGIMNRGRVSLPFAVHYFPKRSSRKELHEAAERLGEALKTIKVNGSPVRGVNLRSEISDGVLIFLVDYNLFTVSPQESAVMEALTSENRLKG